MDLSKEQIERAAVLNPYFQRRLGWNVAGWGGPDPYGREAFAWWVAGVQHRKGLVEDGILGPITRRSLGTVVAKGTPWVFEGRVLGPENTGLGWDVDYTGTYQINVHRDRLDLGVVHWSETTSARQTYQVLVHRNLSVDTAIDPDGTLYQFSDPTYCITYHAGVPGYQVNRRAWGVEMTGGPPGDFTPKAIGTLIKLCQLMSDVYGIPRVLPVGSNTQTVNVGVDPRTYKGEFLGNCGHYHLTTQKTDPGILVWKHFLDAGWTLG